MADTAVAETAVREYLLCISEPDQLVDQAALEAARARVEESNDPVDRLLAIAEYERLRQPVEAEYRAAFVRHARTWADKHRVPPSAFRDLGVPIEVLREAKLADAPGAAGHRGYVRQDDAKAAALDIDGPFGFADVVKAAGGGSPMTIRRAVSELVKSGHLRELGPTPNWEHRGRAPLLFERVDHAS